MTGWFQNNATFGAFTLTSPGGYDIFIVKYDNNGQALWAVCAGGTGTDIGYGIDLDANGNANHFKMKAISPLTDFSYDFHDLDFSKE